MTQVEVDKLYFDAVLHFRALVETYSLPIRKALDDTLATCTLGLNQRGHFEDEVRSRYTMRKKRNDR